MFDIEKMKEILEGDFYRMPSGMTRDEMREFIIDVAEGKVEPVVNGIFSFNSDVDEVVNLEELTQL